MATNGNTAIRICPSPASFSVSPGIEVDFLPLAKLTSLAAARESRGELLLA